DERLVKDVGCVLDRAQPTDARKAALAADVADRVAVLVEALLSTPQGDVDAAIAAAAAADFDLDRHLTEAREWVMRSSNETRERAIYHQMSAFILLAT
ncbi:hypothetical protein H4R19_007304, partial [Coemansia spiralis]